MNRSPRLPRHRMAPGQLTLDAAMIRAQRRYPEALRFVPSGTGRPLAVLPGGTSTAPPAAAVHQRRAA